MNRLIDSSHKSRKVVTEAAEGDSIDSVTLAASKAKAQKRREEQALALKREEEVKGKVRRHLMLNKKYSPLTAGTARQR